MIISACKYYKKIFKILNILYVSFVKILSGPRINKLSHQKGKKLKLFFAIFPLNNIKISVASMKREALLLQ